MSWNMKDLEERLKSKQIKALVEALEEIPWQLQHKMSDESSRWLAEQLWAKGIRGVYKI